MFLSDSLNKAYLFGGKFASEYGNGLRHRHQILTISVFDLQVFGTRFSVGNGGILTPSDDKIAFFKCSLIEELTLINVSSEGNLKTNLP